MPAGGRLAGTRFPELVRQTGELIVISDLGGVYRDADAWLMCLYALVEYREWSSRLAAPALRPFARVMFETLSASRHWLSSWLGLQPERWIERRLDEAGACPTCR